MFLTVSHAASGATCERLWAIDRWLFGGVAMVLCAVLASCSGDTCDSSSTADGRVRITAERELMETLFRIDIIVDDEAVGREAVSCAFDEIARAEGVLSNWDVDSQISEVNRAAGVGPVVVSPDLMNVLQHAFTVSELTGGAFDITFASCGGLWSIRDRRIPGDQEIAACLAHVDYRRVALDFDRSAVFVADPEMRLGIDGLAKGYRVDRAAEVLESRGVADYVVDGGGDMRVATSSLEGAWPIGVTHPRRDEPLGAVELASGAIATSGDYEWYFEEDGVRYHHILDPATGRPARRCTSATVIAATTVDADALATGLFVMGPDEGIALAERLPGVEAMLISADLSVHTTSGFPPLAVLGTEGR